ncbi:MAG: HAMP domain-containing histidine kinase [Actinobacteria bacterium]|nr:HAMP domain-containing histidine kinase [Actinomycetota bacterium]
MRITAGALVVVVAMLSGAGLLVIGVVQAEMTNQIDAGLRADAEFTQRMISTGSGLPMGQGPTNLYVQFVAPDGRVGAAGTAAQGLPPLAAPATSPGQQIVASSVDRVGAVRVLSEPVASNPKATLVLASSAQNVIDVHDTLLRLLVELVAAGSVVLSALIWLVVGRALRPVDAMRRRVDGLGDRDLSTRLEPPRTGDELDRLAGTLNELLGRLELAVAREHRFVADASHELRTPITAVRSLLETEASDPSLVVLTRADALARLNELQDLVEELLALARVDVAEPPPDLPVDLDELVLGHAHQLQRSTHLRIDTSRVSGGQVAGRDTDLGRLVENLASNASRYARSSVAFTVHQFGDTVDLVVDDDGPGIPHADRDCVFERFHTLDPARNNTEGGAGLGLSIAAAIVASHLGTIRVGDAPGGGARFEVRLPAYQPRQAPAGAPPEATLSARDTQSHRRSS